MKTARHLGRAKQPVASRCCIWKVYETMLNNNSLWLAIGIASLCTFSPPAIADCNRFNSYYDDRSGLRLLTDAPECHTGRVERVTMFVTGVCRAWWLVVEEARVDETRRVRMTLGEPRISEASSCPQRPSIEWKDETMMSGAIVWSDAGATRRIEIAR
jgi:hypothetical protein